MMNSGTFLSRGEGEYSSIGKLVSTPSDKVCLPNLGDNVLFKWFLIHHWQVPPESTRCCKSESRETSGEEGKHLCIFPVKPEAEVSKQNAKFVRDRCTVFKRYPSIMGMARVSRWKGTWPKLVTKTECKGSSGLVLVCMLFFTCYFPFPEHKSLPSVTFGLQII